MGIRGEIYTDRLDVPNGRRCYFFNIKENRNGDHFINIVESINRLDNKFARQEIVVYEEHLEEFQDKLNQLFLKLREIKSKNNSD